VPASLGASAVMLDVPEVADVCAGGEAGGAVGEGGLGGAGGDGGGGGVAGGGGGVGGGGAGGDVTVGTVVVGGGAGGIVTVTVVVGTWPSAPRASASAEPEPAATSISPAASQPARRPPFPGVRMSLL
jgi:hypothetical protein